MMYNISKDFIVPDGDLEHVVRIVLHSDNVDKIGFVLDYNDLAPVKEFLKSHSPYIPPLREFGGWAREMWPDFSPDITIETRSRTGSPTEHHFHFSASHRLDGLADNHPCSRLHGHNYRVVVFTKYREEGLPLFSEWIDGFWDHRHINDLVGYNPTAENMAKHMYMYAHADYWNVTGVAVSETPKTWAVFGEGDIYGL
jgi:6-pyruvoyltetrahydropterin/6-carboxytetrahydropterin synthase